MTADATLAPSGRDSGIARAEVEEFLYREAELLDDWNLDEWIALFTEDARYYVPCNDAPQGENPPCLPS